MQCLIGLFACSELLPRQCSTAQRPFERVGAERELPAPVPRACCCLQGWGGQRGAAGSGRTCSLPSSCSSSAVVTSLDVKPFEMPLLSFPPSSPARMENNPWCWGAAASLPWSPRVLRKHVLDKQAFVCPKEAQVRARLARAGVFSLR